jgi:hypothetical protein
MRSRAVRQRRNALTETRHCSKSGPAAACTALFPDRTKRYAESSHTMANARNKGPVARHFRCFPICSGKIRRGAPTRLASAAARPQTRFSPDGRPAIVWKPPTSCGRMLNMQRPEPLRHERRGVPTPERISPYCAKNRSSGTVSNVRSHIRALLCPTPSNLISPSGTPFSSYRYSQHHPR